VLKEAGEIGYARRVTATLVHLHYEGYNAPEECVLHVGATTTDGKVWHTMRNHDGTWRLWTDVAAAVGSVTKARDIASAVGLALVRIAVFEPNDVPNVQRLQQGFSIRPLHGVTGRPAPRAPVPIRFPAFDAQRANGAGFIEYFNFPFVAGPAERQRSRAHRGMGAHRRRRRSSVCSHDCPIS
jgi:hypothetical protein